MQSLFEPWNRSWRRTLAFGIAVAAIGAVIGLLIDQVVLPSRGAGLESSWPGTGSAEPGVITAELHDANSTQHGLRVLFIGNSFTAYNSMPEMVTKLAVGNTERPRSLVVEEYAPGGSTLLEAAHDPQLIRLVNGAHWDMVVLQEQSQLPELSYWLKNETLPVVTWLNVLIQHNGRPGGAIPLEFETWGYQHGDQANYAGDSYEAMQQRLHDGYGYLANVQGLGFVPVGDAWALAHRRQPLLQLWGDDGRHASLAGSYLTAAVFDQALANYASGNRRPLNPEGNRYTAGLPSAEAAWLRHIAALSWRNALAGSVKNSVTLPRFPPVTQRRTVSLIRGR
ncbi:MAG TPA: hypothetical protein VGF93_21735 [Solirubrobacteraceae bacterium]|jgi:hypothetical protein